MLLYRLSNRNIFYKYESLLIYWYVIINKKIPYLKIDEVKNTLYELLCNMMLFCQCQRRYVYILNRLMI